MNKLKAINDSILFQFVEKIIGNKFQETTSSGFIIMENEDKQLKSARWGKVLSVGNNVKSEDIVVDEYVLIEPLMWTTHLMFNNEKIWRTSESKILATSTECPLTL